MLSDTDKEHRNVCGMDEADERADHVADSVTLWNYEAVESADGAKGSVEVAGLGDGIGADEGLSEETG